VNLNYFEPPYAFPVPSQDLDFQHRIRGICLCSMMIVCFVDICTAKHAALRNKNTDWVAWNQENVSEWDDMSIRGRFFQ
jgi:hypothetical protein